MDKSSGAKFKAAYANCMAALKQARAQGFSHKPLSGKAALWSNQLGNYDKNIVAQSYMHEWVSRLLNDDGVSRYG